MWLWKISTQNQIIKFFTWRTAPCRFGHVVGKTDVTLIDENQIKRAQAANSSVDLFRYGPWPYPQLYHDTYVGMILCSTSWTPTRPQGMTPSNNCDHDCFCLLPFPGLNLDSVHHSTKISISLWQPFCSSRWSSAWKNLGNSETMRSGSPEDSAGRPESRTQFL